MVYIKNIPNQLIYVINKSIDSLVDFLLSFEYENLEKRKMASSITNINMLCVFLDKLDEKNKNKLMQNISYFISKNYQKDITFLNELSNEIVYHDLTFAYDIIFFKHYLKKEIINIDEDFKEIINHLPNNTFKRENYITKEYNMDSKLIEVSELVDELTFKGYKELSKTLKDLLMIQKNIVNTDYRSILAIINEAKKKINFQLKEDIIFQSNEILSYSDFKKMYDKFVISNNEYSIKSLPLSYIYYRRKKLTIDLISQDSSKITIAESEQILNDVKPTNITINKEVIKNIKDLDVTNYYQKSLTALRLNQPDQKPSISVVKLLTKDYLEEDGYRDIKLNDKDIENFIKENWISQPQTLEPVAKSTTSFVNKSTNLEINIDDELTLLMVQKMRQLNDGFYGIGIFKDILKQKKYKHRDIKDYIKKIDFSKYVSNYLKFDSSKYFSINIHQPSKWIKSFYSTDEEKINFLVEECGFDYYEAFSFVDQNDWPESLSYINNKKIVSTKYDFQDSEIISNSEITIENDTQENEIVIVQETKTITDLSILEKMVKDKIDSSETFFTVSTLIPDIQDLLSKDNISISYSELEEQISSIIINSYNNHTYKISNNIFIWNQFDGENDVEKIFIEIRNKFFPNEKEIEFSDILNTLSEEWIVDADTTKSFKGLLMFKNESFENIQINKAKKIIIF